MKNKDFLKIIKIMKTMKLLELEASAETNLKITQLKPSHISIDTCCV